jgi:predicted mannosyl-3-phosphoglycerate phosphatase (HAD superfamily)
MIIALDWDHTLMNGKMWLPGAKEALMRFKEEGHIIVINSCNSKGWIERNLNEEGIIVDYVNSNGDGKPVADIYIDDRGYRFPRNGSWTEELPKVLDVLQQEREFEF